MKKFTTAIMALALVAGALVYTGCNTEDASKPVITLKGDADMDHTLNAVWTDPGATALDDEDGDLTAAIVVDEGGFDKDKAGTYTFTYTVSDAAGNVGEAKRKVNVVNQSKNMAGTYSIAGTDPSGPFSYTDVISASNVINHRIWVTRLGNYNNGAVYFDINGNNVVIPMQTVNCGTPAANRTFSGTGTINGTTITIDYIENTNGTAINVNEIYTKQ